MKRVVALFFIFNKFLYAAFNYSGFSCKANSFGGVSIVEEEPLGVFLNPVNLYIKAKNALQISYFRPYGFSEGINISNSNFIFSKRIKIFYIGLGSSFFDVDELYQEKIFLFGFSTSLKEINKNLPKIKLGATTKLLNRELLLKEQLNISNTKTTNFSYDLGFSYSNYIENFIFAVALKDINQPNVGFLEEEKLPFIISFSNKYNFGDIFMFEDVSILSELKYRNQTWGSLNEKVYWGVGFETYLNFNTIALRVGLNKNSITLGFGYSNIKLKNISLTVDYSIGLLFNYFEPLNSHILSIKTSF